MWTGSISVPARIVAPFGLKSIAISRDRDICEPWGLDTPESHRKGELSFKHRRAIRTLIKVPIEDFVTLLTTEWDGFGELTGHDPRQASRSIRGATAGISQHLPYRIASERVGGFRGDEQRASLMACRHCASCFGRFRARRCPGHADLFAPRAADGSRASRQPARASTSRAELPSLAPEARAFGRGRLRLSLFERDAL